MAKTRHNPLLVACCTLAVLLGAMAVLRLRFQFDFYADLYRAARVYLGDLVRLDSWLFLLLVAVVGVMIVSRSFSVRAAVRELGLHRPILPALVFALLATLPMLIGLGITGTFAPEWSLLLLAGFAPFVEEVLFRGFAFRQLHVRAGWGFWPAAIVTGLIFGLAHIEPSRLVQFNLTGNDVGAALLTGAGGVWFAWMFMQWRFNLWSVILLHMTMNLWWAIFATDGGSVGTGAANVFRVLTIVAATVLTIYAPRLPQLKRGVVEEG